MGATFVCYKTIYQYNHKLSQYLWHLKNSEYTLQTYTDFAEDTGDVYITGIMTGELRKNMKICLTSKENYYS